MLIKLKPFLTLVGEVKNCFVMWFLWRAAQTSTEVQQCLVYTAQ